jgi:hypothetical protein
VTERLDRHVFHQKVLLAPGTDALIPASALRNIDPRAYETAVAKYDDTPERRRLRDTVIPRVNRAWTEVVFLSPVDPRAIWRAWLRLTGERLPPVAFWAVPAESLPDSSVVLSRSGAVGDEIPASDVTPFDAQTFRTRRETTAENAAWLAALWKTGRRGGWFHGIPHVLSPEPIPLTAAAVISWDEPPA